jgi:peptide/nickel transport system substrate-binding protein
VVYERFEDYVPRDEPPSFAAGGKVVKVDRVEWHIIPDAQTAMSAIMAGEVDYYENPPPDLVPILADAPGVEIETLDPLGNQGMLRMNHLHPPFDNQQIRQAVLKTIDQEEYMRAAIGNPELYKICYSYYACGTPLETDVGTEPVREQDFEKARQLFEEAGYDGRPVVTPGLMRRALQYGAAAGRPLAPPAAQRTEHDARGDTHHQPVRMKGIRLRLRPAWTCGRR